MSRTRYLVTYDICESKRLRAAFNVLTGFGDHIQYSVFICDLNDRERVDLEGKLRATINHAEDQVLLFRLGKATSIADSWVASIGRAYEQQCRTIVI